MGKKRSCRMTEDEKDMHDKAVKLKKMTDAQLCEFIDRTYGRGMEDGAKFTDTSRNEAPRGMQDGTEPVKTFITYLTNQVGSGNRIGNGTILQLNREFERAEKNGIFKAGQA